MDLVVKYGEGLILNGQGDLIVTADTLSSAYDAGCDKKVRIR
jgi:hypothetical protein